MRRNIRHRLNSDSRKFNWKEDWKLVVGFVLIVVLIVVQSVIQYSFENKMSKEQIFDMKLYLLSTLFSVFTNAFVIGLRLVFIVALAGLVVICVCLIIKKQGDLFWNALDKLLCFVSKWQGKICIFAILVVAALIFPGEDMREYYKGDKRILPIMAIGYQVQDLIEGPVEMELTKIEPQIYSYTHHSRHSSSTNKVYYTNYERVGVKYRVPSTIYFYNQLNKADLLQQETVRVLVYPNTGMIVDFVEKPVELYSTDGERMVAIIKQYGYPYLLRADEVGRVEITKNPEVPEEYYTRYFGLFEYEAFWVSYNGGTPYESYLSFARTMDSVSMEYDGTYEIQIGKNDGRILSETLTFEIKDGYVESINGVPSGIEVYDPVKPASAEEEYSEEMSRFLEIAESLYYEIDRSAYHYIFERDKRYFNYKYIGAFQGSMQSSIQVYECENGEDARLTYESWIDTYGTEELIGGEEGVYALRGNYPGTVDNGILARKGNFVYIFWDENLEEAKEVAQQFGCIR